MQKSEVVLSVLRERGRRGLPLTQLYRQMFNKDLYLLAYGNIYSNQGAMTPGTGGETADGMSEEKIEEIAELMRQERYRFSPARRTYIPKKNGKLRPLGIPSWSDKLVGEVVRLLLEAYYEPGFSDRSHGFRKGRGCHTALREIRETWSGTTWFIEGDIRDCFGSLDQEILVGILAEKIHDQRFLRLMRNMLRAGYLEDWEYHETLSGCPQGGVVSPVLSNIYLHKLDEYVERELIPQYTRGERRRINPEYNRVSARLSYARKTGNRARARDLGKQQRSLPSRDPVDPGYRRLKYSRYADDHILGFIGPRAEAEEIKAKLAKFLRETLGLELSAEKTLITHARSQPARFLGYDIIVQHAETKITSGRRSVNGTIALRVPPDVWKLGTLRWNAVTSMLKPLAAKHHSTVTKMAALHKAKIETSHGLRTCFEVIKHRRGKKDLVARFGGIPLKQDRRAAIRDPAPVWVPSPRKELLRRLLTRECELCETGATVAVHQVPSLKELGKPGTGQPAWAALMAKMRRKTLIVCAACHDLIHTEPVAHAA